MEHSLVELQVRTQKNNRTPNTGDNGMNMLYAFGLAFAACGVLVINRIYRKEK